MACASAATVLIRRLAPEFAAVTDVEVDSWVETAALVHNAAVFGATYTLAMARYAAHLMTRAGLGAQAASVGGVAAVGGVGSISEGDLSITFDGGAVSAAASKMAHEDVELTTTRHGLAYLAIRNTRSGVGGYAVLPSE